MKWLRAEGHIDTVANPHYIEASNSFADGDLVTYHAPPPLETFSAFQVDQTFNANNNPVTVSAPVSLAGVTTLTLLNANPAPVGQQQHPRPQGGQQPPGLRQLLVAYGPEHRPDQSPGAAFDQGGQPHLG